MYRDCLCSVTLAHGALGWSAVCDCGISCSYLLTVWSIRMLDFIISSPWSSGVVLDLKII